MVVFFGLSVVLEQLAIVGSLLSFFGSLLVLVWPRPGGWIPPGLDRPRASSRESPEEPPRGVVYTMAIPLLVVGLVLSLAIGGARSWSSTTVRSSIRSPRCSVGRRWSS